MKTLNVLVLIMILIVCVNSMQNRDEHCVPVFQEILPLCVSELGEIDEEIVRLLWEALYNGRELYGPVREKHYVQVYRHLLRETLRFARHPSEEFDEETYRTARTLITSLRSRLDTSRSRRRNAKLSPHEHDEL